MALEEWVLQNCLHIEFIYDTNQKYLHPREKKEKKIISHWPLTLITVSILKFRFLVAFSFFNINYFIYELHKIKPSLLIQKEMNMQRKWILEERCSVHSSSCYLSIFLSKELILLTVLISDNSNDNYYENKM